MAGHLLYSTNPYFAYEVAHTYLKNRQPVWCCESFDPGSIFNEAKLSMIGPSSSPRAIAKQLREAVEHEDQHSPLITRYRQEFTRMAADWSRRQMITDRQAQEIRALARQPNFRKWRPLVYLIPRQPMQDSGRLHLVPVKQRAAHGAEWEIRDLDLEECDILEWR